MGLPNQSDMQDSFLFFFFRLGGCFFFEGERGAGGAAAVEEELLFLQHLTCFISCLSLSNGFFNTSPFLAERALPLPPEAQS